MANEVCGLCSLDKETHKMFERNGKVHHKFSVEGKLKRIKEEDKVKAGKPAQVISGDPALRLLLIEKGIITDDDLARVNEELRTKGYYIVDKRDSTRRGRDTDSGNRTSTERGVRDLAEPERREEENSTTGEPLPNPS